MEFDDNDENDGNTIDEYFEYIKSLKTATPDETCDYTLILYDKSSNCLEEAPLTFNFNSTDFHDMFVAEIQLNFVYHNIAYKLIPRTNRYLHYIRNFDINKLAYENTIKIDVCIYEYTLLIYRTRIPNMSFSDYLKNRKEVKTLLNRKLPKDVNVLQYIN